MPLTLRPATRADLPTLLQFEQGIITAERPYDRTLRPDPISYYDLGALIDAPDAYVIVAELNGEIIASASALKQASRPYTQPAFHAYLGFMYVAPEHRGNGVNKLLLNDLFAWAKANDLPELHLTVYPGNAPAIRAYTKTGFEPYILEMRMNLEE